MKPMRMIGACALIALLGAPTLHADVRTQEKSQVKFEGVLGRVVGFFGGKAAKEGIVTTVALKGDRKMTSSEYGGQIIDLAEEKVYDLNIKDKTYTVKTFAEIRKEMEEAARRAKEQAEQSEPSSAKQPEGQPEKQYEIDFSLKESGQKRNINGYGTREVVMTIVVREKGKTLEQGGGVVMTANSWLGPRIAEMKQLSDFDRRYFEQIHGPMMGDAQQMAIALAMFPAMKSAMERFQQENVNLDGTPILTVVTFQGVKNPEQAGAKTEEDTPSMPKIGGMLGGLGKKFGKKKSDSGSTEATGGADKSRVTILTMNHEVLSVTPSATAADVGVPAGFKQK